MSITNICKDCKNRKGGWCKFFQVQIYTLGEISTCTAYKKKSKKVITNTIKKQSIKQEKRLAKDIGAKRTPKSGAIATSPSDMIKGQYIIESKATKGKSISVKESWLSILKYSHIHLGKIPTLILEFPKQKRYVVMAEEDFNKLIEGKNNESE